MLGPSGEQRSLEASFYPCFVAQKEDRAGLAAEVLEQE